MVENMREFLKVCLDVLLETITSSFENNKEWEFFFRILKNVKCNYLYVVWLFDWL